jgi:hypothetical protein
MDGKTDARMARSALGRSTAGQYKDRPSSENKKGRRAAFAATFPRVPKTGPEQAAACVFLFARARGVSEEVLS